MAVIGKGVAQIRGDFGNPTGSGYAKITVDNVEGTDAASALAKLDTFVDALKSGGFTACNVGKTSITQVALQGALKPGADVSIDDQLIVTFVKGSEGTTRVLTIPGCPEDAAILENKDAGRRLTDAGATTLEGLIDTLMGWTDEASVTAGKWISKR